MKWIKISDQKPPDKTWVILGRIRSYGDDTKDPFLTVYNIGEYDEKGNRYCFAFQLDREGQSPDYNVGVMMKHYFGEVDPNECTHWMEIPLIECD